MLFDWVNDALCIPVHSKITNCVGRCGMDVAVADVLDISLESEEESPYLPVNPQDIHLYRNVPLFFFSGSGECLLYKPAGKSIAELRVDQQKMPSLFILRADKKKALQEIQRGYNLKLEKGIRSGNLIEVKQILSQIIHEAFDNPRSGKLQFIPDTVDLMVNEFSQQPENLSILAALSFKDYTTAIHSINVMALTLGYCFYTDMNVDECKRYGIGALFHDIGKTEIPDNILKAPRKLTNDEFSVMKTHPTLGHEIILHNDIFDDYVLALSEEHHEKLDGSGYPQGKTVITECAQIVGIIDAYEALTSDTRPYRDAMKPIQALRLLKQDADQGKLNAKRFSEFAYSLVWKK